LKDHPFAAGSLNRYEMYQYLRQVKRTPSGVDGLPSWLIKEAALFIAELLSEIFNKSITTGIFRHLGKCHLLLR
jgi:hypothetical protein